MPYHKKHKSSHGRGRLDLSFHNSSAKRKIKILTSGAIVFGAVVAAGGFAVHQLADAETYALGADCTPHAILGDNGNLNFVCDSNTYTVGNTYTDNLGSTTIAAVYDVPTDSSLSSMPDWAGWATEAGYDYREDITSANFDDSFANFEPTSTACWFYVDTYLASITNVENLHTSSVTDMNNMFDSTGYFAADFSLDLSSWDTSNVTDMSGMFYRTGYDADTFSLDLSNWDTSSVTDMENMFRYAGVFAGTTWSVGDLSNWDTSNVTNMSGLFYGAGYRVAAFPLDLSGWNTSNVTNMSSMFYSANVSTIYVGDGWNTDAVTESYNMFGRNTDLVGGNGTKYSDSNPTDKTYARIDAESLPGYFTASDAVGHNSNTGNTGNTGDADATGDIDGVDNADSTDDADDATTSEGGALVTPDTGSNTNGGLGVEGDMLYMLPVAIVALAGLGGYAYKKSHRKSA